MLDRRWISFQRTKTWKESPDAAFDTKLARIEYAINERPDRTFAFAFDEFGPLGIRPTASFHGCYSVGDDQMGGINRRR